MLRFDIPPVNANVARFEAFITFAVCLVALLGFPYLLPILALMGLVRGFFWALSLPIPSFVLSGHEPYGHCRKKRERGRQDVC